MTHSLSIRSGQFSTAGRKEVNQDFHGIFIPEEPLLSTKGIAIALADGISSSHVSQDASQTAVTGFFDDYFSTSEVWSVKTSAENVLRAINSWLYSQTRRSEFRYNRDKGYVCTFSGLVFKGTTAHLFHAGDSRIYHLREHKLTALTSEHRIPRQAGKYYLGRALGKEADIEIDYQQVTLQTGDRFILLTDGVYESLSDEQLLTLCQQNKDLQSVAQTIADNAFANGSDDNLTVQIVEIDQLPHAAQDEIHKELLDLPFPPALESRMSFDGYFIKRQLHVSARSQVYLAVDTETDEQLVIKTLSGEQREDPRALERFLLEEWIARRINNPHVLKPSARKRRQNFLYITNEFVTGKTLAQWMRDNPAPEIETVRDIVGQIAKGLQAFHRREMLHQDLRPENIMIDTTGTVKIIDFGSVWVAGIQEMSSENNALEIPGTALYSAPEYFIGDYASERSDQFSLAVIAYQMLSGRFPYGTDVAKTKTRAGLRKLKYQSVLDEHCEIPVWLDFTLGKALHPNPQKRYDELSEFIYDVSHPNRKFINQHRAPLMERKPILFWQGMSLVLSLIIIALLLHQQLV